VSGFVWAAVWVAGRWCCSTVGWWLLFAPWGWHDGLGLAREDREGQGAWSRGAAESMCGDRERNTALPTGQTQPANRTRPPHTDRGDRWRIPRIGWPSHRSQTYECAGLRASGGLPKLRTSSTYVGTARQITEPQPRRVSAGIAAPFLAAALRIAGRGSKLGGEANANRPGAGDYSGSIVARPSSTHSSPKSNPCSSRLGSCGARASRTTRVRSG
jgi:hypothetical protein